MFRNLLLTLTAALLLFSTPAFADPVFTRPPTVDISAIRSLLCTGYDGNRWMGSGSLIGNNILVTAYHVANAKQCIDMDTGTRLIMYKYDHPHDLALMTGSGLPTNIPYIRPTCTRFVTDEDYFSWGRTFYGMDSQHNVITRMNLITATKDYTGPTATLVDGTPAAGMRIFNGFIAPGMSGGPVTDKLGNDYAVNNAGDDTMTIEYEFADGAMCHPELWTTV